MNKLNNVRTVTYDYDGDYYVDLVYINNTVEAWLYRKDIGYKDMMFGYVEPIPSEEELIKFIEMSLNDPAYIKDYVNAFCNFN